MNGDLTLREEFFSLRGTLDKLVSIQAAWNNAHEKHSTQILGSIDGRIDKLFLLHEKLVDNVSKLPCDKHDIRILTAERVAKIKIESVEKRLRWLWSLIGLGVGSVVIVFLVKVVLNYLKDMAV